MQNHHTRNAPMKTINYIDAALKATKSKTYNQLAIKLQIPRQRFHEYTQGKARPDEYACTRIAVALGLDPARVIAEIALEWEKSEEKRKFWCDFLRHVGKASAIATAALIFTISSPPARADGGQSGGNHIKTYYAHSKAAQKPQQGTAT